MDDTLYNISAVAGALFLAYAASVYLNTTILPYIRFKVNEFRDSHR